jgi:hypothetical protein
MRVEALIYGVEDVAVGIRFFEDNCKPRIREENPGFAMWMLERADAPELSLI